MQSWIRIWGANRQLHQKEINLAKQKTSEYANLKGISQDEALKLLLMAGASMTDMLWNNSFDANSQDLAQAKEYLSQFKDQTYIDKDGNVQNYFVAKENDYTKPYINLYEAAFSGILNVSDYLKSGITQSPYQGIMDKIKNATDHALNNKADTAKAVGSEIKNSLSDCASSPLKCSSNILQSIGNGIIDGTYGLAYNTMPSLANDLNSFYGFMASDYLAALSTANILGSGLEATGAAGLGKVAKDGVVAIGKASVNGASKIANQIETNALTKITENLPKNAMYNKTNGIISIENKNFIQVGTDTLTNSPILREIGYNQGNYILKGNHYVSTKDGLYMVGKNALQKTGTKVVTNSNLAEFMRPGLNPISNAYYDVVNFVIDPKTITYGAAGVEIVNDIFNSSMPPSTGLGTVGAAINDFFFSEDSNIKKTLGIENEC